MKSKQDICMQSATTMAAMIKNGDVTSEEVTREILDRIEQLNPDLKALITVDGDQALKIARERDHEISMGTVRGPFHGVPITIKDSFATKGMKTTNGYTPLANHVPDFDATVVARMREAGAVIVGKSNLPPLAMDLQSGNEIFGRTGNPWDSSKTSGGSSGGAASAVAGGLSFLDIGSDIGGSIRVPTSFCGIYGFKPSENRVSSYGHMPGTVHKDYVSVRNLPCYGPIARSVDDLRAAFSLLTGDDGKDALVESLPSKSEEKKELSIGWATTLDDTPVSQSVRKKIVSAIEKLDGGNFSCSSIENLPFTLDSVSRIWGKMIDAQFGSQVPSIARLMQWIMTAKTRKEEPGAEMLFPLTYKNYMRLLKQRDAVICQFRNFMKDYDALILPVSSTTAFHHIIPKKYFGYIPVYDQGVDVDGVEVNYWKALSSFTTVFNVLGNPVVTIPSGLSEEGMPVGLQIVGKRGDDHNLLSIAQKIDAVVQGYQTVPQVLLS